MPRAVAGIGRHRKLLSGDQFRSVFKQRQSVYGRYFGVHISENNLNNPRLGLTVSKKVSKKAVQRNRIKRQIRESFRLCQNVLISADYVVISKVGGADQENYLLREELDKLWIKANNKCKNC